MSQDLLQQAIAAVKAGDKAKARSLLEQVLQTNPLSEQGWLWLSAAVETGDERRFCLSQVLSINPGNLPAQRGLTALGPGAMRSLLEGRPPLTEPEATPPAAVPVPPAALPKSPLPLPDEVVPAEITCPRCGASNPVHFAFCDQCGAPLTQTQQKLKRLKPAPVQAPPVAVEKNSQPSPSATPRVKAQPVQPIEPVQTQENQSRFSPGRVISILGAIMIICAGLLPWAQTHWLAGNDDYHLGVANGYGLFSTGITIVAFILLFTVKGKSAMLWASLCAGAASVSAWLVFGNMWRVIPNCEAAYCFRDVDLSVGVFAVFLGTAIVMSGFLIALIQK